MPDASPPEPIAAAGSAQGLRARILAAAEAAFVAEGFHAATMDMVARAARCSKKTLYKLFTSKEELFHALLDEDHATVLALPIDASLPPPLALRGFLLTMGSFVLREESLALMRIAVSQMGRDPVIWKPPHAPGEDPLKLPLDDYLAALEQAGEYSFGDPAEAARMLLGMVLGAFHHEMLTGLQARIPHAALERRVDAAIRIFLRGSRQGA